MEGLDDDLSERGDECAEGGDHWVKRRYDEDGGDGWYETCTQCGELLDTSDDSHL